VRCQSEVGLSVVKAVMVYMVNDEAVGRFEYLSVHPDKPVPGSFALLIGMYCVIRAPSRSSLPFIIV